MKNDEIRNERLVPFSGLKDYKIAKDNPDVLGWRVVGADGESLGMVKDLIVDMKAMKVRYLSVVADRRFFSTDRDQYILVPIGAAALDKKGKKIFVSSIDSKSVSRYPVYDGGLIPDDYEYAVRDTIERSHRDMTTDTSDEFDEALHRNRTEARHVPDDFYEADVYNQDRFYTSDQEVYRDRTYTTHHTDPDKDDSVADLHREDHRPKSVEDSIATIERLENLRERGSITEEEFIILKKRALDL